jgi:two-component system, chemotaxis family, protein-glutamate methylesterase/glutaminase
MNDARSQEAAPKLIRVLVVDDSAVQRSMLINMLEADGDLTVVGWATNGEDAIQSAAKLKPDVITMDLRMPMMDGLQATRRIMQETPVPIVIVTASLARDVHEVMGAAFQAGALAIVAKPMPGARSAHDMQELRRTVRSMSEIKVLRRWAPERLHARAVKRVPVSSAAKAGSPPATRPQIVAIGASTGGPKALQEILTQLPAEFTLPVVIVQHIAGDFVTPMVDWLRPQCAVPVEVATAGQQLDGPGIYFAPQGQHLRVRGRALALTDEPPVRGHRPSATMLFESVARQYGAAAIGVLLTGMGDDGASGLRDMKTSGAQTIAQDEASSVVFGMPAVAIGMGIVDHILPPFEIAPMLVKLAMLERIRL